MAVFLNVGVSHKQTPIEVREQLAVPAAELPVRLQRLREIPGVREAMLVSTCNRLEIFAVAERAESAADVASDLGNAASAHAMIRTGEEALLQLFRVCASLDSMVVGEAQIFGQVKDAHDAAKANGASGRDLNAAMARAATAAKRVRTETAIARGAVSVSSVAVELAVKVLGDLSGRSVLLVGAGEVATLAARELKKLGASELVVANRSPAHAEELAAQVGGTARTLLELPALLERADVALCSAASPKALVTAELMARVVKARRYRPIFLIDLSLPRNVEPAAHGLENVYVYDLDDLEKVTAKNRDLRAAELERAEAIVAEELAAFLAQRRERDSTPVLAKLRKHAQSIAEAEAERTLAALGALDEQKARSVRAMAVAIVNKLLHTPTQKLRAEAGGPLCAATAELFDLGGEERPQERAG